MEHPQHIFNSILRLFLGRLDFCGILMFGHLNLIFPVLINLFFSPTLVPRELQLFFEVSELLFKLLVLLPELFDCIVIVLFFESEDVGLE
jgi:hypothetical protein